jgi:uncharacterized membrane-anchored protein YitT (DUF2179 family)
MLETIKAIGKDWRGYLIIVAGCFIAAISFNLFLTPNRIAPGGVGGIGIILHHLFGFPVGVTMLVINVPLFLSGIMIHGRHFGIKTLLATVLLSVFIDGTVFLPLLTDDLLLAAVLGGAMLGLGLGLVFARNGTTGGTDLMAKLLHTVLPFISMGKLLFFVDVCVVAGAAIVFQDFELGLYAGISIFIGARVIDLVLEGVDYAKLAIIISDRADAIADGLLERLDRGVTGLHGKGMYTRKAKNVLLCITRNHEIPKMKQIVRDEDPDAFVIVTDVREAQGEGFKKPEG